MGKRVGNEVDVWTSGEEGCSPGQSYTDQNGLVIRTQEDELALWLECNGIQGRG